MFLQADGTDLDRVPSTYLSVASGDGLVLTSTPRGLL